MELPYQRTDSIIGYCMQLSLRHISSSIYAMLCDAYTPTTALENNFSNNVGRATSLGSMAPFFFFFKQCRCNVFSLIAVYGYQTARGESVGQMMDQGRCSNGRSCKQKHANFVSFPSFFCSLTVVDPPFLTCYCSLPIRLCVDAATLIPLTSFPRFYISCQRQIANWLCKWHTSTRSIPLVSLPFSLLLHCVALQHDGNCYFEVNTF